MFSFEEEFKISFISLNCIWVSSLFGRNFDANRRSTCLGVVMIKRGWGLSEDWECELVLCLG